MNPSVISTTEGVHIWHNDCKWGVYINFAYWPLLQFLLSLNAYLKDGVCKFVVSFAQDPDLVIAIEIVRYCIKMSTKRWET